MHARSTLHWRPCDQGRPRLHLLISRLRLSPSARTAYLLLDLTGDLSPLNRVKGLGLGVEVRATSVAEVAAEASVAGVALRSKLNEVQEKLVEAKESIIALRQENAVLKALAAKCNAELESKATALATLQDSSKSADMQCYRQGLKEGFADGRKAGLEEALANVVV